MSHRFNVQCEGAYPLPPGSDHYVHGDNVSQYYYSGTPDVPLNDRIPLLLVHAGLVRAGERCIVQAEMTAAKAGDPPLPGSTCNGVTTQPLQIVSDLYLVRFTLISKLPANTETEIEEEAAPLPATSCSVGTKKPEEEEDDVESKDRDHDDDE